MLRINKIFSIIIGTLFLFACNKDRYTDIILPAYKSELVVECYLEPGKPYRLLLTESVSYFEPPSMPKVSDAVVTISHMGVTDTLKYITFTLGTTDTTKVFNFYSNKIVENDFGQPYILNIKDSNGRVVTGSTSLLPPPSIDSVELHFETRDTMGFCITRLKDDQFKSNYYRYVLLSEVQNKTISVQDLYFDELLSSPNSALLKVGNSILIKSPNEFSSNPAKKNKHIVNLYHMEEAYYKFLKSVSDARDANGNPFAQPPSIKSNVKGGKGIFTGITVTKREIISPD